MARMEVEFYSHCLLRPVSFKIFIPSDPKYNEENPYMNRRRKTLFMLHGYTDAAAFQSFEDLGWKYNFAMVMPNGENGFYLDGKATGRKYCTYTGEELVGFVRNNFGLALTPEETYVMGISMGGFGAIHTA